MVHAKLHIICGNCGSNEYLNYEISKNHICDNDGIERDGVVIHCNNCATLHSLNDTILEKLKCVKD